MECIELDGSRGEGGGQILRTALTLSMITGTPFRIVHIRARRKKPGLLRQHLTAVKAAATICDAEVHGDDPGSLSLHFVPGKIRAGDYRFAIGSAGSCTLVLQTLLPALWYADGESSVRVSGGTHNPMAPPADFLIRCWLPILHAMGIKTEIELLRHGFYPAGGGEVEARVSPVKENLLPFDLTERGELISTRTIGVVAGVPVDVARREMARAAAQLGPLDEELRELPSREGPGNVLMVELVYPNVTEIFSACGERGLPAEAVADKAAKAARLFRDGRAAVGEYLSDQLLIPMALAGRGRFSTNVVSSHLTTNREVIERFLPVRFEFTEGEGGMQVALND